MALASVAPPSTVVRTPVKVFWKAGFSWLAARISRHCTRGRPASIMTENCRKKMAMSLVLTLFDAEGRHGKFFALFPDGSRRDALAPQLAGQHLFVGRSPLAADLSDRTAFFPENVKTGMVNLSSLQFVLPRPLFRRPEPLSLRIRLYRRRRQLRPLPVPADAA